MALLSQICPRASRRLPRAIASGLLLGLACCFVATGRARTSPTEYQVKAVFLLNFAQFTSWPDAALAAGAPLVIGVLGDDPFGAHLDQVVQAETVDSHPVQVRRFHRVEEIERCHILFVSASESSRLERIVAFLRGRAVLTVSDADEAARRGAMIRFLTEQKRIKLRVNLGAVRDSGLTLSSKLLRSVEVVDGGPEVAP